MPSKNKGKKGNKGRKDLAEMSVQPATSAAAANAHYDPETDTLTLNKGQDEVTLRPCNPATEKEVPACNFVEKIASVRIQEAPPGVNSEPEAIVYLRQKIEEVDALWMARQYVGVVSPLSRMSRADGTACFTGTATFLREYDGVSDVSLALVDSRTGELISRREYSWFLRVNGRVFEQRPRLKGENLSAAELVGETEAAPAVPFPKVIPFKVIPAASSTSVDYVLEESLVAARFPFLAWRVSFRGYVFGNPPARFATSVNTWAYLETLVDGKACTFEMRGATGTFHVGNWADVCERRKQAEEEQKRKQQEEADKARNQSGSAASASSKSVSSAEAQLQKMFS